MSPATRRSASARWSWWRTSSDWRAATTTDATPTATWPRSAGSSAAGSTPGPASMTSTPHGPSEPGIATAVSGRPPMTDRTSLDVIGRGRASCRAVSSTMPSSPGRRPVPAFAGSSASPITPKSRGSSTSRVEPRPELATGWSHSPRSSNTATARCGPWSRIAVAASDRATATVAAVAAIRVSSTSRLRSASWRPASTGSGSGAAGGSGDAEGLAGGALAASDGRQQLEPWPAVAAP